MDNKPFFDALLGKKIPILTLDNKWYKLLDLETRQALSETEEQLNVLLRRQGKINTEIKEIRKLKKQLMNEIVEMAEDKENADASTVKKIEQNKKLIAECNEKIDSYHDELLDLPAEIEKLNSKLMLATMEYCYTAMQENAEQIRETDEWVKEIRIELKKRLVRKQEMEQKNKMIYAYMHDLFGAEVVDLFDLQYVRENQLEGNE